VRNRGYIFETSGVWGRATVYPDYVRICANNPWLKEKLDAIRRIVRRKNLRDYHIISHSPFVARNLLSVAMRGKWHIEPYTTKKGYIEALTENDVEMVLLLAIAKQCVDLTGGTVRGADKATIKFDGLHAVNPAAQATQPAAQATQPAVNAPAVSKYEEALLKHLNVILSDPIDSPEEKSAKMNQLNTDLLVKADPTKHGHTVEWVRGRIVLFATQNGIPNPFMEPGGLNNPPATDDLPF